MGHGSLGPQGLKCGSQRPLAPAPGTEWTICVASRLRARARRAGAHHGANGVERKAKSKKDETDGNIIHLHMR